MSDTEGIAERGARDWVWAGGLAAIALLLRGLYVWRMVVRYGADQFSDFLYMDRLAQSLAAGNGFTLGGERIFNQSIGYPFLLSLFYRLFGPHWAVMMGMNAVLGALSVALIYLLARSLAWEHGRPGIGRKVAVSGALLALLYPDSLLYCAFAASENLLIPLLLLVFLAATSKWKSSLLQGAVVGILAAGMASVKAYALLLCLLLPLIWWYKDRRFIARTAAAALLGVVCLAPWTYLNYVASEGRFVPFASIAGTVVLDGTNPLASGKPTNVVELGSGDEVPEHPVDLDRAYMRKAIGYIKASPGWYAKLCVKKVVWGLIPIRDFVFEAFDQVRMFTPILSRWGTTAFNVLVLLGSVVGIGLATRDRTTLMVGVGLFVAPMLIQLVFCAVPRYRFPFWFCLTPYVGYGGIRVSAFLASKCRKAQ